jgi:hypothetical protein
MTENRRNLSGIYIFHKFDDEEVEKPTCFEDCPEDERDKWLKSLNETELQNLSKMLAKTLRGIGDQFDILSE